jgi:hypothetical protein
VPLSNYNITLNGEKIFCAVLSREIRLTGIKAQLFNYFELSLKP